MMRHRRTISRPCHSILEAVAALPTICTSSQHHAIAPLSAPSWPDQQVGSWCHHDRPMNLLRRPAPAVTSGSIPPSSHPHIGSRRVVALLMQIGCRQESPAWAAPKRASAHTFFSSFLSSTIPFRRLSLLTREFKLRSRALHHGPSPLENGRAAIKDDPY